MWKNVIKTLIVAVENLVKPLVKETTNPVDDIGVDVILGVLKKWVDSEAFDDETA